MKIQRIISLISINIILFGCATGSTITTGDVRPAIDPTKVKIYLDPPLKYETIGLVEASNKVVVSRQAAQDGVVNELKKQAAKVGANGVLLVNTGTTTSIKTSVYSSGFIYSSTSNTMTGQGRAIFVIQE